MPYVEEEGEKEEALLSKLAELMKQLETAIEKGDSVGEDIEEVTDKAGKNRYPNIDEVIERLNSAK